MRGWMFSSVMSGGSPVKERRQRVIELREERADGDCLESNAEVRGQLAAVVDGAGRGIGAGHADADDVLRAESIGGDGGDERGVDAAAQADDYFAEAAFAHVIARTKHKRAIGSFGFVVLGHRNGRSVEGIDDDQVLLETKQPAR